MQSESFSLPQKAVRNLKSHLQLVFSLHHGKIRLRGTEHNRRQHMKTIANLLTIQAAQALKLKLGSAGIEVHIPDEISASLDQFYTDGAGIRLQVADEDELQAKKILKDGFDYIEPVSSDAVGG
ncbi:MAG: hypothetical protein AAF514_06080 [Verrucomicrobiota bacterium]